MIMLDTCENCYEEAVLVKMQGMQVCSSCKQDFGGEMSEEDSFLMDTNEMIGVMSDDDVLDMFKKEYVGY